MALAALLSCIIPLHFGLLTVGLGRRRFISGKRRGGEGNRNTQRNDHRNEALHGCFSVYCACPRLATAEPRSRKGALGVLIFRERGRALSWHVVSTVSAQFGVPSDTHMGLG
jgi:hypothetical protein